MLRFKIQKDIHTDRVVVGGGGDTESKRLLLTEEKMMKSVLDVNILLENPQTLSTRDWGFKNVSTDCL
jgi:hypothetical protein